MMEILRYAQDDVPLNYQENTPMHANNHRLSHAILPWLVWSVSTIFLMLQLLLQICPSVMVPDWQHDFQIDAAGVGFLSASFFYTYFFLQVPAGMLVDHLKPRRLLAIGILICAIAIWIFAQAESLATAVLMRMLMGVVAAPAFAAALYVAANWFSPRRFALVAGFTETLGMVGAFFGQTGLVLAVTAFGWRITLEGIAIAGACSAILIWFVVRDHPREMNHTIIKHEDWNIGQRLWRVIGSPQVWLVGLFSGLMFATLSAMAGLWGVPYLETRFHVTPTLATLANATMFLGVGVGSPILGWLSDHIGRRKPFMWIGAIICLVLLIIVLYVPNLSFHWIFPLFFFLGFISSVYMLPFAIVREITPKAVQGAAMGFTNMMSILIGSPILQPLIGHLLELRAARKVQELSVQDYTVALSILPFCVLLAVIISCFVKETYCREILNKNEDGFPLSRE